MNPRLWPVFLGYARRHAGATLLSTLAIALGVSLGVAVNAVNRAALEEFAHGMRTVSGTADLEVRGPRGGFDESLYPALARRDEVALASPALEIDARLPGREEPLRIVGVDVPRAARLQPALLASGDARLEGRFALLDPQALFLSPAAAHWLDARIDDKVTLQSGLKALEFRVAGLLPGIGRGQRLGVIDIAAAQERFDRIGSLSRIDLRLRAGADTARARQAIQSALPAGVFVVQPEDAQVRAANLSRAYRVNLTMLALIALVTGAFLVFSTEALAVVRRRAEFALLRALGLTRRELVAWLVLEGAAGGALGAVLGIGLGYALAAVAVSALGGDLGAGYFSGLEPSVGFDAASAAGFCLLGIVAAALGALAPALEAARTEPALALKAGDAVRPFSRLQRVWPGLGCLAAGIAAAFGPPLAGLPVFGYLSVALLLAGAVLVMPALARRVLAWLPMPHQASLHLALAQLRAAPGHAVVAGAGVLASVAVAAAMAIMVASFRDSVDAWLRQVLPADLYVRASRASESGFLDLQAQRAILSVPGVAAVDFVRHQNVLLDASRPPVGLVARKIPADDPGKVLPLVARGVTVPGGLPPLWVSEAVLDLYGSEPGGEMRLPLAGREFSFAVAGVWRDYARQHGAVAMDLELYRRLTGDMRVNDAGIRLRSGQPSTQVAAALRRALESSGAIDIAEPGEIRALSLRIFDRTFAVTYALEAVAVLIGLFGVGASFGALAAARRREFGMLRHVGMTRSQIGGMLAAEGVLVSSLGVVAGLALGAAIGVVLIEVVNRQSFHWSMDMVMPWQSLSAFALSMIALATLAAVVAARQAMRVEAVRAVREDW